MSKIKSLKELFSTLGNTSVIAQRLAQMISDNKITSIIIDSEMLTYWTKEEDTTELPEWNFTNQERCYLAKNVLEILEQNRLEFVPCEHYDGKFEEGTLNVMLQQDYMSIAVHKDVSEDIIEKVIETPSSEHSIYF